MGDANDLMAVGQGRIQYYAGHYPEEIVNIFKFISRHTKIFRSQQISDTYMCFSEKYDLVELCFARSRKTFIRRFGPYLLKQHLCDFAQHAICEGCDDENEIQLILEDLQQNFQNRKQIIRNRRYAAMEKMLKEGHDYFSEQEMMLREPELYQELVGQYMSDADKAERDRCNVRTSKLSDILMDKWVEQEVKDLLKETQDSILEQSGDSQDAQTIESKSSNVEQHAKEEEVVDFGKQWGNLDDEQVPCTSKKRDKTETKIQNHIPKGLRENKSRNVLITATERMLLRQEFLSIMKEKFLSGTGSNYSYSDIDADLSLEDFELLNQDAEDEYFDESDDDYYALMAESVEE